MSSPPPTKPPRGVKQGKETSGLLMSVIRTLSASETNEQREKERAKLEKEYKKSDAKLDELVAAHTAEIMEVMQKFSQSSAALSAWGTRCDAAVARLAACRSLLRLRRDDLTRLWTDARTHHYALQMLTDIERVVVSEREVYSAMAAGRVLAAAVTLRGALQAAGSTLERVTALHHTRDHLQSKKRELVEVIVKRLSRAVYRAEPAAMTRRPSRRRTALLLAELMKTEEVNDAFMQDITPEFEASLQEEDKTFETGVMISLEALGVLDQLKEGAEKFKVQIQSELLEVIDTISQRIIEEGDVEVEGDECEQDGDRAVQQGANETGRPLVRLITCLADEFRAAATRNNRLLQLWKAALHRHHIPESCLHTEQHYWSAVQQVLQLLLTEYLEIESVTLAAQRAGAQSDTTGSELRLADYFAKRRPSRRRVKLFTLDVPSSGGAVVSRVPRYRAVCRPSPRHLHRVLPALHALCRDTELSTGGGECSLRAFITNYVREGETERLASAARAAIDAAMRDPAAWRETAPPVPSQRGSPRLIYATCNVAWRAVSDAALAARRCGACGGAAAARAAVCATAALAAHARHAHARLAPAPPHPSRAARWLSDDDIVRFLQSLPNWRVATSTDPVTEDKQLEQELKQAYDREAEILGSSLGDGAVARREIVADISALAAVALLCETMNWLSTNIRGLPQLMSGVKLSDKLLSDIASAALIFDEIEHKCLLFLHLEIRIQCFHYLGQEGQEGAEGEAEGAGGAGGAARLAQALLAFHEHAGPLLAPHRLNYVLNGVGEMMSAGVILRWQWGAASSARLATLRHCLAALQLPHVGLHSAHNYLRLLAVPPEEIIARIKEKGPEFSELEYLNAFKVIGTKRGLSQADMKPYLKQLADALGTIGVTV